MSRQHVIGLFALSFFALAVSGAWLSSARAVEGHRSDLVNREVLRVCADPSNLPFSNDKNEGFENKIANILGEELKVPVEYTWFPQVTGFLRNTLFAKRCDIVISTGQGDPSLLNTNSIYSSTYALVYKPGTGLDGVDSLFDPRLQGKRIGVVAGTPPANLIAKAGLMGMAKPYQLVVDRRYNSPAEDMIKDIRSGEIAAGRALGTDRRLFREQGRREADGSAPSQGRKVRSSGLPHHHGCAPGRRSVEAPVERYHPQAPGRYRSHAAGLRRAAAR